ADEGAIAAELARDNTAAGQRHAAAARAARPTAEAKEEAWASVVDSNDLPNAMQAAVLGGFVQVEQRDLLRPYIERYFDTIEKVWQSRTSEVAQTVVVSLYPTYFVEQATLDRTEAFLRDRQPPPALRRLLVEGSDAVRRALRAQQRDAQQDG
ncbi:MAG: ERAP1-like C-terminal domain-containing protein, partial [Actinomycetota bacterium]|nr:ERAP1-like C-terminal domain-containing protein [Actinomycetota bacterium]